VADAPIHGTTPLPALFESTEETAHNFRASSPKLLNIVTAYPSPENTQELQIVEFNTNARGFAISVAGKRNE